MPFLCEEHTEAYLPYGEGAPQQKMAFGAKKPPKFTALPGSSVAGMEVWNKKANTRRRLPGARGGMDWI